MQTSVLDHTWFSAVLQGLIETLCCLTHIKPGEFLQVWKTSHKIVWYVGKLYWSSKFSILAKQRLNVFHFQAKVSSGNWTFQCLSSCDVRVKLNPIIHTNELNLFCLFMWYQKLESFLNFLKSWNEFQKDSNSKTVLQNLLTAIFLFVTREKSCELDDWSSPPWNGKQISKAVCNCKLSGEGEHCHGLSTIPHPKIFNSEQKKREKKKLVRFWLLLNTRQVNSCR